MNPDRIRRSKIRYDSVERKIRNLTELQKLVDLPKESDLTSRQWESINTQLTVLKEQLLTKLNKQARKYMPYLQSFKAIKRFNDALAALEMEFTYNALPVFDIFLKICVQRSTIKIGKLLAGCDAIAFDALNRDHPALKIIEPPITYIEGKAGAAMLPERAPLIEGAINPVPLIQIPFQRLMTKAHLISAGHEIAHEMDQRLGLSQLMRRIVVEKLTKVGAPDEVKSLNYVWMTKEIPDFISWCLFGEAHSYSMMEINLIPKDRIFFIESGGPHPPGWYRVLMTFEWCHQEWGDAGRWMQAKDEFKQLYPLDGANSYEREILAECEKYLPIVCKIMRKIKLAVLNGRTIPELFEVSLLSPQRIEKICKSADSGNLNLKNLRPCLQLAVLRKLFDTRKDITELASDQISEEWLMRVGNKRI